MSLKRNILFLLFIFSISLLAQDALDKGSFTVSGSMTYSNINSEMNYGSYSSEIEDLRINLSPEFGYFVINNLLIMSNFSFQYSEMLNSFSFSYPSEINISPPPSVSTFSIERNYIVSIGVKYYLRFNKFNPFLSAEYGYKNATTGNNDGNIYTFAGGINYFISNSVALEPFFQYQYSKTMQTNSMQLYNNNLISRIEISHISFGIRIAYFVVD